MNDETFSIQISGPGVRIERNVREPVVYKVLQLLLEAGSDVRTARSRSNAEDETGRQLRKAFGRYRPRTNAERIALVVASVERLWERSTHRDEIADWLVLAGESLPSNFSRDLSLAIDKGLIASDPEAGGERYVLAPAGRRRFRRRMDFEHTEGEVMGTITDAARARLLRNVRRHSAGGPAPQLPETGQERK